MITFFPLVTDRTNTHQGTFSRQVPAWLAQAFSGRVAQWFATRGEESAHLLLLTPLPTEVIQSTMAQHGHSWGVAGTSHVEATRLQLVLELLSADGTPQDRVELQAGPHRDVLQEAVRVVERWTGVEATPSALPDGWRALSHFLGDLDNEALRAQSEGTKLRRPEDRYVHLLETLKDDPTFAAASQRLQQRIERWQSDAPSLALQAARALAVQVNDATSWRQVAQLAEPRDDDAETYEQALRRLAELEQTPESQLKVGVYLLQRQSPSDAMDYLTRAQSHAPTRDAAETYLGVAHASVGNMDKAIGFWTRIVRECEDPKLVEIAKENLRRARPPQGPR